MMMMMIIEDPSFHSLQSYINLKIMALVKIKCNTKAINKSIYELDLIM